MLREMLHVLLYDLNRLQRFAAEAVQERESESYCSPERKRTGPVQHRRSSQCVVGGREARNDNRPAFSEPCPIPTCQLARQGPRYGTTILGCCLYAL